MKRLKRVISVCMVVLLMGAGSATVFAAHYQTPAEAVAGLTSRTVESVVKERTATGKNYGTIAFEAGKLQEFQAEMLEMQRENLNRNAVAGMSYYDTGYYCDGTEYGHDGHDANYDHTYDYNGRSGTYDTTSYNHDWDNGHDSGYGHDRSGHNSGRGHGGGHH